jgi:hypothetical protein
MTDEKKSYKVTDRRHSTLESEAAVAEEPPVAPEADHGPAAASDTAPPPADFITFIVSLAHQAAALMGGAEGAPPDLKGARWLISIIEMLGDKTEGRRTPQETEALESILYELRMVFVERSRAGGA